MSDLDKMEEYVIGPQPSDIVTVGLSAIASLVGGFVGGAFIFMCSYTFLGELGAAKEIFPYALGLIGFFANLLTLSCTVMLQRLIFPDKYRSLMTIFSHTYIFSFILFIAMVPVYIIIGRSLPDDILLVLIAHILLNVFGATLLTEIIASYRYVLLGFYASFIGLLFSTGFSVAAFGGMEYSRQALFLMVAAIIAINTIMALFRSTVEWLYYILYRSTSTDYLGDVFAKIEEEDKKELKATEDSVTFN